MSEVAAFFASPRLVDLVLLLTLVEAIVLMIGRKSTGRSLPSLDICLMLLPGVFLMLAIRASLAGAAWPWIPVALAAALVAHLLDLQRRFRG